MAPAQEVNPRLIEAAMEQLKHMHQPEMSNTDSITIIINKGEPDTYVENYVNHDAQAQDAYNEGLLQQDVQQRTASILKDALGRDTTNNYDFTYSSCNPRRRTMI